VKKIRFERERDGALARVTLAAPKANILDGEMLDEISTAVDEAAADRDLKLLIFDAEGEHFSFGASVREHRADSARAMLRSFHAVFEKLSASRLPTIALVRGRCLGGGMELALFCHFVFARRDALFGQPEIALAVFPPIASIILPLLAGQRAADELVLGGKTVSAEKMAGLGLVNDVFESEESLRNGLRGFVEENILPRSASSLRFAVQASRLNFHERLRRQLPKLESLYLDELMAGHDAVEGIEAFLAKRPPEWRNE